MQPPAWLFRWRVRRNVRKRLDATLQASGYEVSGWDGDVASIAGEEDLGSCGQIDLGPLVEAVTEARNPTQIGSIIERMVTDWIAERALRDRLRADVDTAMHCVIPMPGAGLAAFHDPALCAIPWVPELIIPGLVGKLPGIEPVLMRTFLLDHEGGTVQVTRGELSAWGITLDELDDAALANLRKRVGEDQIEAVGNWDPDVYSINSTDGLAASRAFLLEELVPDLEEDLGLLAVMPQEHTLLAWPVRRPLAQVMVTVLVANAVRMTQGLGNPISHEVIWIRGGKADRICTAIVPVVDDRTGEREYEVRVISVEDSVTSQLIPVNVTFE